MSAAPVYDGNALARGHEDAAARTFNSHFHAAADCHGDPSSYAARAHADYTHRANAADDCFDSRHRIFSTPDRALEQGSGEWPFAS